MSDTNLPEGTGGNDALSVDDGADAISEILKDPETDLSEEDQDTNGEAEETEAEGVETPDAEESDDKPNEDANEEEDGPKDYEAGRFASDDAKVRLKDGSVISVQDLKRGYLSQSSFTRGTQENAREREALASRKSEVEQHAQAISAERDFLLQVAQQFVPQLPDRSMLDQSSPNFDPIRFAAMKADYDDRMAVLAQLQQASQVNQTRLTQDQQRQQQEARKAEAQRLVDMMPELKKPEVYRKFWSDAVETMSEYGFSQEELDQAIDHRLYPIFRDLAAYRRARKQLPVVKKDVQSKPVLSGKKRMDPKSKISRDQQSRHEHLRKTGTFEAGVASLMDIPDL